MAENGYHIRKMLHANVRNWFGASVCVEWVKSETPITATVEFDCTATYVGTKGGDGKATVVPRKPRSPTVKQLKAECKELGLKVSGNKAELIARLEEFGLRSVSVEAEAEAKAEVRVEVTLCQ